MQAIPFIIGTGMQMYEQSQAQQRQRQAVQAQQEASDRYAAQSRALDEQNAQQYMPQQRLATQNGIQDQAVASLQGAVDNPAIPELKPYSGRVSSDFVQGAAQSAADARMRALNLARLMGKTRGPSDLRLAEAQANADFGSQQGIVGSNAHAAYRAALPGIEQAGQPNPLLMLAGSAAQAYGTGSLAGAFIKKSVGSIRPPPGGAF